MSHRLDADTDAPRPRAMAALGFALTASLVYALDRAVAAILTGPIDPRAILATERIDYFWRMGMATFLGTLGALGAAAFARRWPNTAAWALHRAPAPLLLTAALACGLALRWP